ncbi:EpsG family protein [Devosia sp. MC532]|uniref:EpsG family protein n=1 Tax=Devosia sp. MC532 TaxID=2799788 RepID=UPI0018F2D793|nr:EpsG family protein [Devosia sp. MC532]MBJ7579359.1 EpsG family protein [Devosia sp. MC532]
MELAAYIAVVGLACALAVRPNPLSAGTFTVVCFATYVALSVIIRLSGFDVDMAVYAASMHYIFDAPYYLREPVVWYGHRLLWSITGSEVISFVVMDVVLMSVMFFSFKRLRLPQYAYISVISFFPFIMGMQNVYRQFAGSIFFIAAISAIYDRKSYKGVAFSLLSMLSHNVAAVFIFLMPMFTKYRQVAFIAGIVLIPVAIFVGGDTKSGVETGARLEWAYVGILTVCCGAIFFLERAHRNLRSTIALLVTLALHTNIAAAAMLASAAAERVSLFTLLAIYPLLVRVVERRLREKFLLRCAITVFGFIPILVAGTRIFIFGE